MTVGIELSSSVRSKIQKFDVSISLFKLEISEFLSGSDSHLFGRNVRNNNSSDVWHLHFIPLGNQIELDKWKKNYENNHSSYNRTSDNIIFYTKNTNNVCLIIDLMTPNGHQSFKNGQFLQNLENIAEQFINKGIIP